MGNEIVYCTRCQNRLLASDFENAKAVWSTERPYCVECIMGVISTLPAEEEQRILEQLAHKRAAQSGAAPSETPRRGTSRKTSTSRIPVVKTERRSVDGRSSSTPVLLSLAGLAIVVIVVIAALSGGGGTPSAPSRPAARTVEPPLPKSAAPRPSADPPRDLAAARREEAARRALEKAREFGRTNPADLPGRIALLEEAAWESRETPFAQEARREHEQLQKQRADWIASELRPARDRAQAAAAASRYGEAIEILAKERARHPGADWTSAVDQNTLKIRQIVDQTYAPMREKALMSRRRGAEPDVQAIVTQVSSWGLEEIATDLRSALAGIPLPEKPLSAEARAYLAAWETAFALARARDYAAALQALEIPAAALTDPATKADAAADLDLLRLAAAAHSEALQAFARTPKGQKVSLEIDAPPGRIDGTVTRAVATSLDVRTESDAVTVEFDDLTASCLTKLFSKLPGRKSDADARVGGLLLLLEGDPSGASGFPPRLLAYGTRIAQERTRPEFVAREAEARARLESAEREFQDPGARLASFDRYRALLDSHGDTPFVRRKRALILQRLDQEKEAGKEYFFFADQMAPAGAFRLTAGPKSSTYWSAVADAPAGRDNQLEFTFSAKAGTEYRCWAYVGGCCAETFAFDAQSTETERAPVKNTILFLKKTHALHGGRKEPSRFEWVAVPIPKYSSGGPKTVRLLSNQQGFSVGYVLVSSVRTAAPGDALVKEWERSRPTTPTGSSRDAALVAWWTLDDGSGTSVADASPNRLNGTLQGEPVWTSGKRRGALSFGGMGDKIEIAKDRRLYFPGPFTVAAWVNIGTLPKSEFGMYVLGDYAVDAGHSTFALRVMPTGNPQFFWQTEPTNTPHAAGNTRLPVGTWVHLAGVWDGTVRTLYVNGAPDGSNDAPQARPDIGGNMAIGGPGAAKLLYFAGRIDDVRIYNRALTTAEVLSLSKP